MVSRAFVCGLADPLHQRENETFSEFIDLYFITTLSCLKIETLKKFAVNLTASGVEC